MDAVKAIRRLSDIQRLMAVENGGTALCRGNGE
jgi:hypothetical protein